ncbi:MAG: MlaD family protein [Lamprobacter sp.]|uniref:MlaD family protein n=1 Tax=Lamprobacter sp. TaxID=3100796 RepID=UPI002B2625FA|nr:MlaD family protein [Lamprobacter sp.]MEA3640217.1 MlaD family protein [Lamprobacter sp.]
MSRLNRLYSPPELGAPGKRQAHDRHRDLTLAGLFVLLMAGVVVALLLLLAPGLFGGYNLRAYFLDADGLDSGIEVMQEGFTIGRVRALEPVFQHDPDRGECPRPSAARKRAPELPCFRVMLNIQQAWPVPADSVAQLASAGLLRGNIIRIVPGISAATLSPDSAIPTIERAPDLSMQLTAALAQAQQTLDESIRPALMRLQERLQGVLAMFGEQLDNGEVGADLGQGLGAVLDNLVQLSADIEQSVDPQQIQAILGAVQRLSDNLATLSATLPARTDDIQDAVARYGTLADELRGLVESSRPSVEGSLDDVHYILQALSAALTPILANIEHASRHLSALARELREEPASLLRGRKQEDQAPWFER